MSRFVTVCNFLNIRENEALDGYILTMSATITFSADLYIKNMSRKIIAIGILSVAGGKLCCGYGDFTSCLCMICQAWLLD